ncbi:MAG TPA: YigZ family protein [Candidatus Marinimicrobia bacterium]|nr:YigZ family protein [Candidatus Neomarinimicrobiota bacterium]HQE94523.1 YigZ family protein [Candidatus Neomarinimicrobiota bacterium]HQH55199.1 YigZ family protein [Candidatus Neomarinimicrobiota bacterium]HQK10555.1 YigZ family protein [Candidatus Neomarinimicrobiota bacterium]
MAEMLLQGLKTIADSAEIMVTVKDSKFVGYCFPVADKSEAVQKIAEISQKHRKATHICWAYRIYENNQLLYYAHDAGEPRGSAGAPILKALTSRQLVKALVVVVRYFGGTKLGIGGLIRAYGATAGKTLDLVEHKPFIQRQTLRIECQLANYSQLAHFLGRFSESSKPEFTENSVIVTVQIEVQKADEFRTELNSIPGLSIVT